MIELDYRIVYSNRRKKLTITVERDRAIVVHAPEGTPEETVHRIVGDKRQWLLAKLGHPQKYQERLHPPGKEVVSGESVLYLGRSYRIEIAETASGEIEFSRFFTVPPSQRDKRRKVLRDWYIARAKEQIISRVEQHAHELGVHYSRIKIVDSRFRWGSCTTNDNVALNWRLIKAPTFVIDYVIVHELAHLMEANHTPDFWNIVRTRVPKADKATLWLKEHGQTLEEDV